MPMIVCNLSQQPNNAGLLVISCNIQKAYKGMVQLSTAAAVARRGTGCVILCHKMLYFC